MRRNGQSASRTFAGVAIAVLAIVMLAPWSLPTHAQSGGWWPWATEPIPGPRPPPVRRAPPPPDWQTQQPQQPRFAQPGQRSPVCLQLEQRLVDDQRRSGQSREELPRIDNELRQLERSIRSGEIQLERNNCYEYFFLSKTLRRTRRCVGLANDLESTQRRARELDAQRRQILASSNRSYQDDLIRELARNNCGAQYQQEARRRGPSNPFSSLWQDEDTGVSGRNDSQFGNLPFATYRTVCVRLCDGYYFPISFSTLENHFSRDLEACQSKCAAPVDLYFHQNPGGSMDQAMSVTQRQPYTSLKSAFRYRKEYVQGCSCKTTEYTPSPADRGERKTEAPAERPTRQARNPR